METALLIGITGVLGGLALGFGVFVLDKPPPGSTTQVMLDGKHCFVML